ncbi:hypothetical protein OESDEN_02104 [Oesophagostomum dentatum]|uniref:C2H2-type domain-containing protein n=1 Tax=Oesophagostomum dentatum TaxID=61180 RepID=A0A0B1TK18_OESDE|nr:hypothetical protein OESDEN_02104 [Oesophagostomum dentatum]
MRAVHHWDDEKLGKLKKEEKRRHGRDRHIFECETCGSVYYSENGLAVHKKAVRHADNSVEYVGAFGHLAHPVSPQLMVQPMKQELGGTMKRTVSHAQTTPVVVLNDATMDANDVQPTSDVVLSDMTKDAYDHLQRVQAQLNDFALICLRDGHLEALNELTAVLEGGIERVRSMVNVGTPVLARRPVVRKSATATKVENTLHHKTQYFMACFVLKS